MAQVRHYSEAQAEPAAEGVTMRLVIGPREGAPIFNLRVFEVEPGASTPHHSHWWEHEVFVLAGSGVVATDGGETPLAEGSTVLVPGSEAHHFTNTGRDIFRFICLVPQEWLEGVHPPGE